MQSKASLFSILLIVCAHTAQAQTAITGITLRGVLKDDKAKPVAATKISVKGDAFSQTKADGSFAIGLTNQLIAGQTVTLLVSKDRWLINDPVDGKWNVPSADYFKTQSLPVTIVPYGSLALLTPARLNEFLSQRKDELTRARQQNRQLAAREADKQAEIAALKSQVRTDLLLKWEKDYGLTVARMEEVISQYVRTVNPADDDYTKGLKAFDNGNFGEAATLLRKSGNAAAELAKQASLQAFNSYKAEGDSHSALNKYDLAVAAYDLAADFVTIKQRPQDWAELELSRGIARAEFGIRTEPAAARQLLAACIQHYRNALTVYTREQLPQDWAGTQNNLGAALSDQAARAAGAEGVRLYAEAVQAYRQSLTVFTREQLPQDWAMTQNNLGTALSDQAARAAGAEGARLYAEAVQAYRQSLTVRTREQLPQQWATTQNNLGNALQEQAARAEGAEGARLYAEAVQAYRQSLTVFTREQLPQQWATTQNNLGNALGDQAARAEGAEGARLSAEAVQAYRQSLTVRTREQLPQDWAMTQNNLGTALKQQAARAEGAEGARLSAEAVQAYRQSLTVYTREQLPQDWAMTQNNLGNALSQQAARAEGAEGARLYAEAVQAYRQSLIVRTREQLPQQWATTQYNLGIALSDQAARAAGAEGARLYAEAVQAYRQSLTVYTREQLPQDWAMTQNNLGVALRNQAELTGGEQGARLAREAIQLFEAALQVRERETLPQDWLQTQNNLAKAYYLIEDWPKAARAYDNVLSMRPDNEQGLSRLSGIYHEQLFRLAEAFALNERRVKLDPADLSAQSDWAETHFTTARFAEAETRLAALLANPKLRSSTQTALCVIEIANALALGKAESVKPKLAALIAAVAQQPADFRVGWSFNGTLHFIGQNEKLAPYREWLRQLFNAVQAENRDAIVKGLSEAKGGFKL